MTKCYRCSDGGMFTNAEPTIGDTDLKSNENCYSMDNMDIVRENCDICASILDHENQRAVRNCYPSFEIYKAAKLFDVNLCTGDKCNTRKIVLENSANQLTRSFFILSITIIWMIYHFSYVY
ncbi:hypothetical protein SNEBB_000042 [Seison nebaliae]|nr:hypothetical protein SNEBB_000042 [Seison nebaliae]